ncbi:MAG: hypothetical protein JSW54_08390 [Fidelibacterota bacterium]|nr:MAG: hypothetical protein JSW54_08390 [Candidatus Neomarinimicrobiota bacterium]
MNIMDWSWDWGLNFNKILIVSIIRKSRGMGSMLDQSCMLRSCRNGLNKIAEAGVIVGIGLVVILLTNSCSEKLDPLEVNESDIVLFEDEHLENVIREKIGIQKGLITAGDLEEITDLFVPNDVWDLAGIEYLINLVYLKIEKIEYGPRRYSAPRFEYPPGSFRPRLIGFFPVSLGPVDNLSAVAKLTDLQSFIAADNEISDLTFLSGLTNIAVLVLNKNNIKDLTPLINNPGLGEGDRVSLHSNPLSLTAITEQIPMLKARGVTVEY